MSEVVRKPGIEVVEGARNAEAARHESDEKYRRLFQALAEGSAFYELIDDEAGTPVDWRVIEVNDAYERHTGIRREQIVGRRISEVFPDAIAVYLPIFTRVVETQTPESFETYAESVGRYQRVFVFPAGGRCFASTIEDISGRKRSEEALRISEEKFSKAFRNSPIAITITRLSDGKIIEGNESVYNLLGYSHEDVIGKSTFDLGIWADPEDRKRLTKGLSSKGFVKNEEFVLLKKDRTPVVVDLSASLITIENQQCFLSSFIDITERKRMEDALRKSEERSRIIASSTPDHLLVQDRDLKYTLVLNPQLGLTESDMLGKTDHEILGQEDADKLTAIKRAVLETGKPARIEMSLISVAGKREFFAGSYVPKRDARGQVDGLIGYFQNVSARKRLEIEREQIARQRQLALDAAQLGWWHYDPLTRYSFWDQRYKEIFGGEGLEGPIDDILPRIIYPDDLPALRAKVAAALNPADPSPYAAEYRVNRPDGQTRWIEAHGVASFEGTGEDRKAVSFDGTVADITGRKRAEEAVRRHAALMEGINRVLGTAMASETEEALGVACLEVAESLTQSAIGFIGEIGSDALLHDLAISHSGWDACRAIDLRGQQRPPGNFKIHGVYGRVLADGISLLTNDPAHHPDRIGLPEGHVPLSSFLGVPLKSDGRTIGIVAVANRPGGYTDVERQTLELFAPAIMEAFARRRAEAALRESEERLLIAQSAAHVGIWDWDLRANKVTWTPEMRRIFGYSEVHVPLDYESFRQRVHADDLAAVERQRDEAVKAHRPFEYDYRIRLETGEIRWINTKGGALYDQSGNAQRVFGINADITERKNAEALRTALAEQEKLRLGAAVEQASDAVALLDLDGTIRYINAAFESINRISRNDAKGRSYFDCLAAEPSASEVREAVAVGWAWHGQLTRQIAGRHPVELEVAVSPVMDPAGKVIGGLVTEKDITQENALQRQIRQSQKMEALGTLAGGITHDFNNMLGAIIINTELALLDLEPAHPARTVLPTVLQAANRGKELVKQIITFSRQREWEKKALDLAPVVQEAVEFLRSTLSKNMTIRESIALDSGAVLGDASQLNQIIVNLCQNAAQAMRDRAGSIDVTLEPVEIDPEMADRHPELRPGPYVCLTVADSGCGMSQDLVERIFEPFFTTRKSSGGSGLGLAVVHGIVRSYGGAITVDSELGKGSTFRAYFPRWQGEVNDGKEPAPVLPLAGKERVLLVEDEEAQRLSLARSLKRLGYRVTARAGGHSALLAFRKEPHAFDIVITDQTMPRMSGLDLAAEIVKLRPDMPIILCTGFSEKVDGGTVGKSGIRELLMKPFTLQEISRLVRKTLDKIKGRS